MDGGANIIELVNLGAAGAVIAVVVIFLNYLGKRDAEWRSFFTTLNAANTADMTRLTKALDDLVERIECIGRDLTAHDTKVDDRIKQVQSASRARTRTAKQAGD